MPAHSPGPRGLSRRDFMLAAAGAGAAAVAASVAWPEGYSAEAATTAAQASGTTPEQIHLTWGADAASEITVSWISPARQVSPQVILRPPEGQPLIIEATRMSYTDGLSGETVYGYHVPFWDLTPRTRYTYVVRDAATPAVTFTSAFTTAARGRFPFAFTSFGDLGTPGAGATYPLADGSTVARPTTPSWRASP